MQCIPVTLKHCYAHRQQSWKNMKILWWDVYSSLILIQDGVQHPIAGNAQMPTYFFSLLLKIRIKWNLFSELKFICTCYWRLAMLLSPLDVRRVRVLNANALAVMLIFATIVKLNGIRIKRAMLRVHQGKVRCEHHRAVSVKTLNIVPMTSNHAHAVKCWLLKWMTVHVITWCARFVVPNFVGYAWKR